MTSKGLAGRIAAHDHTHIASVVLESRPIVDQAAARLGPPGHGDPDFAAPLAALHVSDNGMNGIAARIVAVLGTAGAVKEVCAWAPQACFGAIVVCV